MTLLNSCDRPAHEGEQLFLVGGAVRGSEQCGQDLCASPGAHPQGSPGSSPRARSQPVVFYPETAWSHG